MGVQVGCNICEKRADWFEITKQQISENFMASAAFACIGANTTTFSFELQRSEAVTLRWSDYGIPDSARIFHINFTPHGGEGVLYPTERQGNSWTPHRNWEDKITLCARPVGVNPPESQLVHAGVAWIEKSDTDTAFMSLVTAFEAFAEQKYKDAIVPANVAVESMVSQFFNAYLPTHGIRKKTAEEFLQNAATYSYQLNVLLPLTCSLAGWPHLPSEIRVPLDRLRGQRNSVGHKGQLKTALDRDAMAELLTAALFGYRYVQLLQLAVEGKLPSMDELEDE
ncbi:conserved hypothetical protein [Paraburkholderia tropica]|nr:conserved hypothetical protein [Paraburkholderia tropica]